MDKIIELSLQLLQTTQAMHDSIEAGELLPLEELQQQRTELVAELDQESQQPYPRDVLAGCRDLIEQGGRWRTALRICWSRSVTSWVRNMASSSAASRPA